MKEEALKLADELAFHQGELSMWTRNESCRMIRRLVEELDKQWYMVNKDGYVKPLSDEVLFEILKSLPYNDAVRLPEGFRLFARAIEERHGIK